MHLLFISYMILHPISLTFQLITFFPNPLGNRFLLCQESSAAFYNCSDYFKYFPCELWKPLATMTGLDAYLRVVLFSACRPDPDPQESVGNFASNAMEMFPRPRGTACSVSAGEKAVPELLSLQEFLPFGVTLIT